METVVFFDPIPANAASSSGIDLAIPTVELGADNKSQNTVILEGHSSTVFSSAGNIVLSGDDDVSITSNNEIQPRLVNDYDGDGGGPLNEVYEPPLTVPDGFTSDDFVGTEFIIDELTGVMTIIMHFEAVDPYYYGGLVNFDDFTSGTSTDNQNSSALLPSTVGDFEVEQQTRKCTITVTRTVTHNSGSATINFNTGLLSGSRTTPSTTTTNTYTVTYEGIQVGSRCYIPRK